MTAAVVTFIAANVVSLVAGVKLAGGLAQCMADDYERRSE